MSTSLLENPPPGVVTRREADRAQGRFGQHQIVARGETVSMLAFPDVSFTVEELLPVAPPGAQ